MAIWLNSIQRSMYKKKKVAKRKHAKKRKKTFLSLRHR